MTEETQLERKIKNLKDTIEAAYDRLNNIEELQQYFPDLKLVTGRWEREKYVSPSINKIATNVEFTHNCGCCSDSPLELCAYIEHDAGEVYADPPFICVGEKNSCGSGDIPYNDWEEKLKKYNFSETIIQKVKEYFDENKPENYEDD